MAKRLKQEVGTPPGVRGGSTQPHARGCRCRWVRMRVQVCTPVSVGGRSPTPGRDGGVCLGLPALSWAGSEGLRVGGCGAGAVPAAVGILERVGAETLSRIGPVHGALRSPTRFCQAGEQSRSELLPLQVGPEPPGTAYRASLEEDAASLSGESLDGHLQGEWGSLPIPGCPWAGGGWPPLLHQPLSTDSCPSLRSGGGLSPADSTAWCGPRCAPWPPPPRALESPHPPADADGRRAAPGPAGLA